MIFVDDYKKKKEYLQLKLRPSTERDFSYKKIKFKTLTCGMCITESHDQDWAYSSRGVMTLALVKAFLKLLTFRLFYCYNNPLLTANNRTRNFSLTLKSSYKNDLTCLGCSG